MFETQIIQAREVGPLELEQMRKLIEQNAGWSRRRLSRELCLLWDWRSSSGQMKDMAARSLLNKLADRGFIDLPARQRQGGRRAFRINPSEQELFPPEAITDPLDILRPLDFHLVHPRESEAKIFRELLARHHYLGYSGPVGQNLQYLIRDCCGRDVACVLFGAAAWKVQARDPLIGWNEAQRVRQLAWIANNARFLILPWVRVSHLASHILAGLMRRLSSDWHSKYSQKIYRVETFVERERFRGTCYRAANWIRVGETKGRSRQDRYSTLEMPIKDIYLFPLIKNFRAKLCDPT